MGAISSGWNGILRKKTLEDNDYNLRRVSNIPGTGPYKPVRRVENGRGRQVRHGQDGSDRQVPGQDHDPDAGRRPGRDEQQQRGGQHQRGGRAAPQVAGHPTAAPAIGPPLPEAVRPPRLQIPAGLFGARRHRCDGRRSAAGAGENRQGCGQPLWTTR